MNGAMIVIDMAMVRNCWTWRTSFVERVTRLEELNSASSWNPKDETLSKNAERIRCAPLSEA